MLRYSSEQPLPRVAPLAEGQAVRDVRASRMADFVIGRFSSIYLGANIGPTERRAARHKLQSNERRLSDVWLPQNLKLAFYVERP
jgi:hypothetical protein